MVNFTFGILFDAFDRFVISHYTNLKINFKRPNLILLFVKVQSNYEAQWNRAKVLKSIKNSRPYHEVCLISYHTAMSNDGSETVYSFIAASARQIEKG